MDCSLSLINVKTGKPARIKDDTTYLDCNLRKYLKTLEKGVTIDGIKCIPTRVKIKKKDPAKDTCIVEIGIVEGRNHIVKKMFLEVGHYVQKLTRQRYAFLDVKGLQSGEYRCLTNEEKKHITEIELDNYNEFDYIIDNKFNEELEIQINNILEGMK